MSLDGIHRLRPARPAVPRTPLDVAADATFDAWLAEPGGRTLLEFAADPPAPVVTGYLRSAIEYSEGECDRRAVLESFGDRLELPDVEQLEREIAAALAQPGRPLIMLPRERMKSTVVLPGVQAIGRWPRG